MKRLIIFLLLFAAIKVAGQTTGYLRFDTIRIYKQGGTAELYLINSTKDSLGVLTNIGGGLTRFYKPRVLNDSTFTVGLDTLVLRGASGGGGGTNNANVGAGYRILKPGDQTIKTLFPGYGILIDSTTNTNGITFKADTTGANGLVTRSELKDSTDRTTYTEKPIYVKTGANDTLALLIGYGLMRNAADSAIDVDSATLSSYYLRRKDSTLYTTVTRLADTAAAIRAGSAQNIQQVLTVGDTAQRAVHFKGTGDTTLSSHSLTVMTVRPPNYNNLYSLGRSGLFTQGFGYYNGVNTSPRPNIVYSILGYNQGAGGAARLFADEASFGIRAESHFEMGGGIPHFEIHLPEMIMQDGTVYRPHSLYASKTTRSAALNHQLSSVSFLYLPPSGSAFDTVMYAMGASAHQFGTMGDGSLSLTNRRSPNNSVSLILGPQGVNFNLGSFSGTRSTAFNAPINISHNLAQNSLAITPGASASQSVISITQGTYTGNRYLLDATSTATGLTGIRIRNSATAATDNVSIDIGGSMGYSQYQWSGAGTNLWLLRHRAHSSLDSGLAFFYANAFVAGLKKEGRLWLGEEPAAGVVFNATHSSALTNTPGTVTTYRAITSGTAAAGFGLRSEWGIENASNVVKTVAFDQVVLTDAVNGVEDADRLFGMMTNGAAAAEKMRLTSQGTLNIGAYSTGANVDQRGLYVNRSIGANKDSIPTVAAYSSEFLLLQDTASGAEQGRLKKILPTFFAKQSALNDTAAAIRSAIGSGGGITSINSETGPAISIAAGTGISVNTTTNTVTVSTNTSYLTSGTYTPTLTNTTNVAASVASACQYMRIGNVVHVSGMVQIDATSATTVTELGISLPVSSDFVEEFECAGTTTTTYSGGNESGNIRGDVANNRALIRFYSTSTDNQSWYFTFTYTVAGGS